MITQDKLQKRLDELARELNVPGAAIAVSQGDKVVSAVTGVTNITTGAAVVPETLFAAGSVSKVFIAALVMTLVDDGLVDLDAPVQTYVPDFTVANDPRSAEVTVRMLLDHSSGLPGNFTFDLPKGPEVVAQFVQLLAKYEFNSPPGRFWSYSNAGLVTAGRVAEAVTGQTFDEALAARVLRPLGLHATTVTDEMILHSVAVGHIVDPKTSQLSRTPQFQLGSNGPSGATMWCDIAALIDFGRMHLNEGRSGDGQPVLSATSVAAMQTPQINVPWGAGVDAWGLGWSIRHSNGHTVFGHTGAGAGQHSMLNIVPDQDGVVAALTNSTSGVMLYSILAAEILQDCFGVGGPVPPALPEPPIDVDVEPFVGVYVADEGRMLVTAEGKQLKAENEFTQNFADVMQLIFPDFPPPPMTLTPFAADGRFLSDLGVPVQFITGDGQTRPEFMYVGRIYRRLD